MTEGSIHLGAVIAKLGAKHKNGYFSRVSIVEQIENALENLTPEELTRVEQRIRALKSGDNDSAGYEYLRSEYGVTAEEWQRFVKRRDRAFRQQIDAREIKLFTGDLDSDLAD